MPKMHILPTVSILSLLLVGCSSRIRCKGCVVGVIRLKVVTFHIVNVSYCYL